MDVSCSEMMVLNSRWTTTTMSASDALVGWPSRAHLLSLRPASPVDPPPTQTPTSIDSALATPVSSLQHSHVVCTRSTSALPYIYFFIRINCSFKNKKLKKQRKKRHTREREREFIFHIAKTLEQVHNKNAKLGGLPERHLAHQSWPPITCQRAQRVKCILTMQSGSAR